jgi:hypothetical protein
MVVYQNYSMGWLSQCGVDLTETTPEQNLRMLSRIQFFSFSSWTSERRLSQRGTNFITK